MKELTVVQPVYVENFSCIGASCRDHCCKRWTIYLDKDTYRKYAKSHNPDIKRIAVTNIAVTRTSSANWAAIKLTEQGNCPYLDVDQLCGIYKRLGKDALSNTCTTYPRSEHTYKTEKRKSLNISCPEAARQVLFNPDGLNMRTEVIEHKSFFQAPELDIAGQLVNLFCANLLMSNQAQIEENLYSMASFLLFYQKLEGDINSKLPHMESGYEALLQQLESGEVLASLDKLPFNEELQWQLLIRLQNVIAKTPESRGRETIFNYLTGLVDYIVIGFDVELVADKMKELSRLWREDAKPFFSENPHILRNYFLYRLHHNQFAINHDVPLLKQFYLIVVDFFFIRSLISAYVKDNKYLTEDIIIDIFYSYHAFSQHSARVTNIFIEEIDKVKVNDDLSSLQLLI
ncbi:flagellin lysine-N-methylase [Yersinia aleksiciae]|uniref:Flagellin lysine-N-methylase n=1 Tax=Yersinia aleksiciae TaxID=263819 RepID=A0A0T9TG96_YERAE|nr:flagellin lysine-N-methylase [Yersinia aleksiciae]MDA5498358.1 flagellin lysine-N-methylase [Yersinia aleksiciae]NIL00720.1 flagellar protein FliB [Yersinia aleksiciae]WQC72198.1 flagellin lysine-N-methylase [Yersinia aleksiciae]CNK81219.1 flagellin lysine-N-methylase [Yersinia aleksiciae]